jgi:hypothetical protein
MLHTHAVSTQRDLSKEFLDAKEVQSNQFLGIGDTQSYIHMIITKWAVHMGTTRPCEFLKKGPSPGKVAKRRQCMIRGRAGAKLDGSSTPKETMKNNAKCIAIYANGLVKKIPL